MRVGTPPQLVNLLPSTLVSEDWVVGLQGCSSSNLENCVQLRGGDFDNSTSSSWDMIGGGQPFSLGVELNLGISGQDGGYWGYDTVGLTASDGSGIVLDHQVVVEYLTTDFYVGILGLSAITSDVENNNQTTFLATLRKENKIPSLSYSYTAGAYYGETNLPGTEGQVI